MTQKVRHVLGISGGKDSAALAIYMKDNYPDIDIEYYTTDTGEELKETYELIERLESYLQKPIVRLVAVNDKENHQLGPFEYFHQHKFKFLPSTQSRWCTQSLKLKPFEEFIGNDPVVSYVGIRGDEDRDGYISKKNNIQSIFPFRKNIWSQDVINKTLNNSKIDALTTIANDFETSIDSEFKEILQQPINIRFSVSKKLNLLLSSNVKLFNYIVFKFLKTTDYPLSFLNHFPLINDEKVSIKEDIFKILRDSGVGIPEYYKEIEFEVDGETGKYARSRSGCYFCFFQQKIEWVWLNEQHPELFKKAASFEKDGYTWNENESLEQLEERKDQIKKEFIQKQKRLKENKDKDSHYLIDKLYDLDEGEVGCAACFI